MVTFDNFNGISHCLTAFDVQADSILQMVMAIRDYLNTNPIVSGQTVAEIINKYLEDHPITGAVTSVNGETGDVTIVIPVTSVNGKTGDVEITESDIANLVADLAAKFSASNPPPYPVTSVNGQTGAVVISVPDAPVMSVNGKTGSVVITISDIAGLTADLSTKYSSTNPPPYPVTSVNGQTGAVSVSQWGHAQVVAAFDGGELMHYFTAPEDMSLDFPVCMIYDNNYFNVGCINNSGTIYTTIYTTGSSPQLVTDSLTVNILYFKG